MNEPSIWYESKWRLCVEIYNTVVPLNNNTINYYRFLEGSWSCTNQTHNDLFDLDTSFNDLRSDVNASISNNSCIVGIFCEEKTVP